MPGGKTFRQTGPEGKDPPHAPVTHYGGSVMSFGRTVIRVAHRLA